MNKILRILCLEDCPSDAELMEYELKEAGLNFTALTVMREKEYVKALREFSPHIILSDYNLPQYDGTRALAEAKARCPATPFIVVTGEAREDLAREMLANGAQDCVMKDQLHRLVSAVQKALGNSLSITERKSLFTSNFTSIVQVYEEKDGKVVPKRCE